MRSDILKIDENAYISKGNFAFIYNCPHGDNMNKEVDDIYKNLEKAEAYKRTNPGVFGQAFRKAIEGLAKVLHPEIQKYYDAFKQYNKDFVNIERNLRRAKERALIDEINETHHHRFGDEIQPSSGHEINRQDCRYVNDFLSRAYGFASERFEHVNEHFLRSDEFVLMDVYLKDLYKVLSFWFGNTNNYKEELCPLETYYPLNPNTLLKRSSSIYEAFVNDLNKIFNGSLYVAYDNDNLLNWYIIKEFAENDIGRIRENDIEKVIQKYKNDLHGRVMDIERPIIPEADNNNKRWDVYSLLFPPKPFDDKTIESMSEVQKGDIVCKIIDTIDSFHNMDDPVVLRGLNPSKFVLCDDQNGQYIPVIVDLEKAKQFTVNNNMGMSVLDGFVSDDSYVAPELKEQAVAYAASKTGTTDQKADAEVISTEFDKDNYDKVDIYSLGVLIRKIYTNKEETDPEDWDGKYKGISQLVEKMTSAMPSERPNLREVKKSFNSALLVLNAPNEDDLCISIIKEFYCKESDVEIKQISDKGSFGSIYKSIERKTVNEQMFEDVYAIKVISIPFKNTKRSIEDQKALAINEARIMKDCGSSHIVSILDFPEEYTKPGEDGCYILIKMNYYENTLSGELNSITDDNAEETAIQVGLDIADALSKCHSKGVYHCDIKPDNIFVGKFREYILGDFGLAEIISEHKEEKSMGTELYAAPELFLNSSAAYDEDEEEKKREYTKIDMYSLGLTLYQIINNGRLPFWEKDPSVITPDDQKKANKKRISRKYQPLPAPANGTQPFVNIVLKMCAYNPEDRYKDMDGVLAAINRYKIHKSDPEIDNYKETNEAGIVCIEDNDNSVPGYDNRNQINSIYQVEDVNQEAYIREHLSAEFDIEAMYDLAIRYREGDRIEKNDIEAYRFFKAAAEQGHNAAMCELGECYENGIGTEKDQSKAFKCYKMAAEAGNTAAMNNLAACYDNGIGTEQNPVEAFRWNKEAAENGDITAMNNLAFCYGHGEGTGRDFKESFRWYKFAAESGNTIAMNNLAGCYKDGIGTEKDPVKAFQWYNAAAEAGVIDAMIEVASIYENGEGTEENPYKAFYWYKNAAERGDLDAINSLAYCYEHAIGVEKNEKEAFGLYECAALAGDITAMNNLAICYEKGIGTERNAFEARRWHEESEYSQYRVPSTILDFHRWLDKLQNSEYVEICKDWKGEFNNLKYASEGGNYDAMHKLGLCYKYGIGTEKNLSEGFNMIKAAAEAGSVEAKYSLAICYIFGDGTERNDKKAFECVRIAAEEGYSKAINALWRFYKRGYGTEKNAYKAYRWLEAAKKNGIYNPAQEEETSSNEVNLNLLPDNFIISGMVAMGFKVLKETDPNTLDPETLELYNKLKPPEKPKRRE